MSAIKRIEKLIRDTQGPFQNMDTWDENHDFLLKAFQKMREIAIELQGDVLRENTGNGKGAEEAVNEDFEEAMKSPSPSRPQRVRDMDLRLRCINKRGDNCLGMQVGRGKWKCGVCARGNIYLETRRCRVCRAKVEFDDSNLDRSIFRQKKGYL